MNKVYVEKGFSKNFLKNILKILKTSLGYATDVVGFVKENLAIKVRLPKYDTPEKDPADFSFIYEEVKDLYCEDNGRPSIDPVVLFKLVFIEALDGLKSMRKTSKKIKVDAEKSVRSREKR